MRQRRGEKELKKSQNNNDNEQPQDFSEPLSPEEAVMTQEPVTPAEPEPAPTPTPEPPAETPSTSNNALIMQIKILSEYAKDTKRSMYAVSRAAGVHHEYVKKAVANLVTAVVEHNGDPEALAEIYIEGSYSLKPQEISKLVVLADNLVNRNQSLEDAPDGGFQKNRPNEGSINRHYNKNTGNRRMRANNNSPFDYYGQQQQPQQQEEPVNDLSTNAQLLKEILENQKNATPTNISKTLRMFTLDEATFINQPNALHGLLHSMFNPVTAQAVFNLFMQMRPKFVQQAALTGTANGIPTYNLGDPQYLLQRGPDAYAAKLVASHRTYMQIHCKRLQQ
jgi:hypothetical protein